MTDRYDVGGYHPRLGFVHKIADGPRLAIVKVRAVMDIGPNARVRVVKVDPCPHCNGSTTTYVGYGHPSRKATVDKHESKCCFVDTSREVFQYTNKEGLV